jgi:hypothetical protein
MSAVNRKPGLFVVVEGADGSGKSAVVNLLVDRLADQAQPARVVRRENPVGTEEYSSFVAAAGRIFGAAQALGTGFGVLSLIGAAQYAVLVESQVMPALESGEVIIAESWWGKTWARLSVEAFRRGALSMHGIKSFEDWQCSLLPHDLVPTTNMITVLIEAAENDRLRWYKEAGGLDPVYDTAGYTSYDPCEFAQFTTELGNILHEHALSNGWPIIQNGMDRTVEEVTEDLLDIVNWRLNVLHPNLK